MEIERLNELIDRVGIGGHIGIKDAHDIADVLRDGIERLRTEPCEWCDGMNQRNLRIVESNTGSQDGLFNYCPNCGRKLVTG